MTHPAPGPARAGVGGGRSASSQGTLHEALARAPGRKEDTPGRRDSRLPPGKAQQAPAPPVQDSCSGQASRVVRAAGSLRPTGRSLLGPRGLSLTAFSPALRFPSPCPWRARAHGERGGGVPGGPASVRRGRAAAKSRSLGRDQALRSLPGPPRLRWGRGRAFGRRNWGSLFFPKRKTDLGLARYRRTEVK